MRALVQRRSNPPRWLPVALLALTACHASYAVNVRIPVDPAAAVSVAGTWRTQWGAPRGFFDCSLVLEQQGDVVTGSYTSTNNPSGRLTGRLVGNELRASFVEADGLRGSARFVFDASGRGFQGTWGRGESDDDGGIWEGSR